MYVLRMCYGRIADVLRTSCGCIMVVLRMYYGRLAGILWRYCGCIMDVFMNALCGCIADVLCGVLSGVVWMFYVRLEDALRMYCAN